MHGSRSKIPGKNIVKQRCAGGFNSGVKGLIMSEYRISRTGTCRQPDSNVSHHEATMVSQSKFSSTSEHF
jgi:hypothetical protein